ncbi:biosynthetic-type acetolactate synthase large subunit [Lachnospiraceae bacterium BSM-380-WT-5A]|uniref:Acetolactate synthase n=1 Tax=Oliverpabstia intestinalis TaxID=2606633 RepID=A0A7X2P2T2_9FIRM|nr:biosynthetic-type acetolactate synthase large subunit [Oliverpabstia intestinalis]MCF2541333.1 biosynthetic-type acetolactate synthase large subunit [Blautia producta]MST66468.1 biosynthetic-type acetolactate synthase large subunit [Oliverpabstia intestinalis]
MQLTGSEIIIECLKEQGVDTVFGYPGGTILNVYDALYKHSDEIHHVLTSHEQGASHAADGYARATGRVGVCMATSGPGATNLVTGIATAHMDSIPMVAITANVATGLLGRDSFQEIDIAGVVMPITKYSMIVKDIHDLAPAIRRAFTIAQSGRPGPVLVDVTKDVTAAVTEYTYQEPTPIAPYTAEMMESDLDQAAKLISEAEKPFIFVGGGAITSGAAEELRKFAHTINSPVTDSLMGKGAFSGEDELYTGMLGMHGTKTSNLGVTKCDLLITVGARFSDRVTGNTAKFAQNAKIIQIDVDAAEINKNIKVDCSIIGDVKEVLKELNKKIYPKNHDAWVKEVEDMKAKYPLKYNQEGLTGPYVIEELYRVTKGDAIVVTDVGQHQMWAAQYYKYKEPRTLITSGGLGTMGYGLGAAIGAKFGRPDKVVVNIAGDGCFRMNMNEVATAARNNLPLIEIVINNHVLGMVRQWQTLFYDHRYSSTILDDKVDFVKFAESMGAVGIRVTKKEEVGPAIEKAIALNTTVVLDCQIDCDDKVFPMVPAGAPIEEVFDAEDLAKKEK